ncbi:MAG TPA: PRTRC system protein E [Longimicrobium sp.]
MNEQPSGGLMQALAPIADRRPVHLIVSKGAAEGALHVVCQPLRVGNDEDPEIGRGFSVEGTPAELDADLPGHVARTWVPAHQSLQSVLDQVAAHAEQVRQATLRKQKEGNGKGKKDGGAVAAGAQTTLAPPPADPAAPAEATPLPAPAPAPEAATQAEPAPAPEAPAAPAQAEPAGAAPGDAISNLFD